MVEISEAFGQCRNVIAASDETAMVKNAADHLVLDGNVLACLGLPIGTSFDEIHRALVLAEQAIRPLVIAEGQANTTAGAKRIRKET